jgi:hypothetical protein|tara:strand:- start:131 stop:493 length:363 start_codon:yes stop_codon:yes gene_type:complete
MGKFIHPNITKLQMGHNKKEFLEALERSLGVVTTAASVCNIARTTHYRWLEEDSDYAEAVKDIQESAIDFAESSLHQQIKNKVPSSTIFYLKTKGKHRGYVEKQEIQVNEPKPFKWFDDE